MLNVTEIAASAEERVLTGVKVTQTMVIDGIKSGLALADRVMPNPISDRVESRMAVVPAFAPIVEGAFDFAGKLLAAQRDFATEIVHLFQPAAVKAPVAKAAQAPVATKAPAKKTVAKKAAAKKAA